MRIILPLLLFATFGFAHKLNVFALYEGQTLQVSSYFASGSGCRECDVTVTDTQGKVLATGRTDKNGEFDTPLSPVAVKITVDAGSGHMGETSLSPQTPPRSIKKQKSDYDHAKYLKIVAGLAIIGVGFLLARRFLGKR